MADGCPGPIEFIRQGDLSKVFRKPCHWIGRFGQPSAIAVPVGMESHVFQSEGVQFVVDPTSLAYLDGTNIDFDDGLHGKGFELKNPNAQSTCGCGKSFN